MKNIDIAHEFFYTNFNKHKRFNNLGYSNNLFYSYSTVIGAVVEGKDGSKILLVSETSMSPTTGRHIANLISACPFNYLRVPMQYGKSSFSLIDCLNDIATNLDNYSNSKLSLKANRKGFIESYKQLLFINDYIKEVDLNIIECHREMYSLLNNSDEIKILKAKLREKAKQNKIKAQEELNRLLDSYSYLDLVEFVYDNMNSTIKFDDYYKTKSMQDKVKKALNPNNDLSFVWIENDYTVRTSKSIRISIDVVKTGLKLWKHNKIKHGYKIECYTVMEIRKDYVQIGCHKIPMNNIKELYDRLFCIKKKDSKELQVA